MKLNRIGTVLVVLALIAGGAALALLVAPQKPPLQKVTLPDGQVLLLKGVTYGTNHVLGTRVAKALAKLPLAGRRFAARVLGDQAVATQTSTTTEPSLKLWIERKAGTNSEALPQAGTTYRAYAADSSGFISGADYWFMPQSVWNLDFSVFPRREEFVTVKLIQAEAANKLTEVGSFRVKNPVLKKYPFFTPDPEHTVRTNGHISVKLERLITGTSGDLVHTSSKSGKSAVRCRTNQPGAMNYSVVQTKISTGTRTNELWEVCRIIVCDPTGNESKDRSRSTGGDYNTTAFSPSLWPSESAWKLNLQFKRRAGFATNELFAFPEIPLPKHGATNALGWFTNVNGCRVTVAEVYRRPPGDKDSWSSSDSSYVKITHSPLAEDFHLDLVEVWFDAERGSPTGWSSSGQERRYWLRDIPERAGTMRLVLATHKGRTLEFTAKPELLDERSEAARDNH